MSTPTPETLRALVEKWRNAVVAKRDMDFNGRARNHESDWFVLQQCADELAALLDIAREEKPVVVVVPDVPGPDDVCWKQGPTMARCTFPAGHDGLHQWER